MERNFGIDTSISPGIHHIIGCFFGTIFLDLEVSFQIQDRVFCWIYHALFLKYSNVSSMSACDHQTILPIGNRKASSIYFSSFIAPQQNLIVLVTGDVCFFFFEAQNCSNYSDVTGPGPPKGC